MSIRKDRDDHRQVAERNTQSEYDPVSDFGKEQIRILDAFDQCEKTLQNIADLSDKPDDYAWYDIYNDYADCDSGNSGDVHAHGTEMGKWKAAKLAREMLRKLI